MMPFDAVSARLLVERDLQMRATRATCATFGAPCRTSRTCRTGGEVLDAFAERAAIMEIDGALPREEAERLAATGLGLADADSLFRLLIADWTRALEDGASAHALAPPRRARLLAGLRFIDAGWALQALRLGWDALALWAMPIHPCRADEGLVCRANVSAIAAIDDTGAWIRTPDLRPILKPAPCAQNARLLWEEDHG